ncbi:MAG: hypothetical protein QOE10_847 [Gaiellales bacterium]|nr:hypothetical protein [Gaiellales bacterium]
MLIRFSSTPSEKSGITSTTGGITISAIMLPSTASRPKKANRTRPNAAMLANSMQSTTEPPVTMNEFRSQRGNWSLSAVRKPCSVGLVGNPSGWSITAACVRKADEIIT